MARAWNKLSANFVRGVGERGRYADGGNLHLQVARGATKAWAFIYQRNGTSRAMGLGSLRSVPLALARELAAQAREQLARGIDPIDARKAAALEQRAARAKLMTFKAVRGGISRRQRRRAGPTSGTGANGCRRCGGLRFR